MLKRIIYLALVCCIIWCSPAFAFTRVQGNHNASFTSSSTFTLTLTAVGAGDTVAGGFCLSGATGVTATVTDNQSNTYTVSNDIFVNTNLALSCFAFYRGNITNGPTILTATASAAGPNWVFLADEFSGVLTSTNPTDGTGNVGTGIEGQSQSSPGTGTDGITSGNITTSTNGDLIYGVNFDQSGTTLSSIGTGFTGATNYSGAVAGSQTEYKTQATAGAVAATYTQAANNQQTTFAIAFKPPGGGAAATPLRTLLGVGQ